MTSPESGNRNNDQKPAAKAVAIDNKNREQIRRKADAKREFKKPETLNNDLIKKELSELMLKIKMSKSKTVKIPETLSAKLSGTKTNMI